MTAVLINEHLTELQVIWDELRGSDELPDQVDAIVVGGCRDLGLAERTAELYHKGVSRNIVISGYAQAGMHKSEARLLGERCIELGVYSDDIVLDEDAQNTGQNILHSAKLTPHARSVILIHKPYMARRFLATAMAQWPNQQPKFYVTHEDISFRSYLKKRDATDTVRTMLGDFKRMDEYVAKGFQVPQEISSQAQDAYNQLIQAGFTVR